MAREAFEEDLQRFRSMKGELEQASQAKQMENQEVNE
jgi:hypothetical protein